MSRKSEKHRRRRLRELAARAYSLELDQELARLDEQFDAWKAGRLSGHELGDEIHRFHDGPSRRLFSFYANGDPFFGVARGVRLGFVGREEVDPELLQQVDRLLALGREDDEAEG